MAQKLSQYGRSIARTGIIVCVLSALLFSHGEGIQLLPFPVFPAGKIAQQSVNSGKKIPYQFSLHRIDNLSGKLETKSSPGSPDRFYYSGSKLSQREVKTFLLTRFYRNNSNISGGVPSDPSLTHQSGRAPPVS